MRPRAGTTALLASSILVSTTGCSYAFVRGPPARIETAPGAERQAATDCTTSNAAPIVDTVLATSLILLGTAVVVGGIESGNCSAGSCFFKGSEGGFVGVGVGMLALGGLSIASAATGYDRTADCRRIQEMPPAPRNPSARYLLRLSALARARTGPDQASPGP